MVLLENQNTSCLRPMPPPAAVAARLCRLVELATAVAFAVPVNELRAPTRRCASVAFARQSAMYLAHVVFALDYSTVGQLFHRDRTTAAHACRLIEDRRDNPAFDRLLQTLEDVCGDIARDILAAPGARP